MTLHLAGTVGGQPCSWMLDAATLGIGRSSRNAIHIPDGTVSKEHAEIVRRGDRFFIRDLGSRNGTRVNGAEAREALEIKAGDRLEIGHLELQVSDQPGAAPVRLSDATVLGSSLKLRVDQILERRSRTTGASAEMVHLLADAGRLLVLPRPLRETCEELLVFVEKAVVASRYVLLLQQGAGGELVQFAARTRQGRANQPLALSRSIVRTVLDECTAVLTGDASLDPRFRGQESIVAQSVHSAMAVPLFDNEKVLGLIYVDSSDFSVSFDEEQLELLTLLGNMAAVKITNARLLDAEQARARLAQELATATQIQRGLLPVEPPRLPGWQFDAVLETCYEVGGDLFDFHVGDDGRLYCLVGDVTGKGMGAALLMSSFLSSARVLYGASESLAECAARLNAITYRSTDAIRFVTGVLGRLDPATGLFEFVNAGHQPPILALDGVVRKLEGTGIPFGVLPSFPYSAGSVSVRPGELLAICSDGIPEAQRGDEFFDERRLDALLADHDRTPSLSALGRRVMAEVMEFVGDQPRTDDITLLLMRRERGA